MIWNFSHPELLDNSDFPQEPVFKDKRVVMYGAGKLGGVVAHCLKKRGINFAAVADTVESKWGQSFCQHIIIPPSKLLDEYSDALIIISTTYYAEVKEYLIEFGVDESRIFSPVFLLTEIDFDGYDFYLTESYAIRCAAEFLAKYTIHIKKKFYLYQLYAYVTTKCSLRCVNCTTMCPYIENPVNYRAKQILESTAKLLDVFGNLENFNFYGGEPFVNPELAEMIIGLRDESRIDNIKIITNGTLIPDCKTLDAMKSEPRFVVRISDYGNDISSKTNQLCDLFEKESIKYERTNYQSWGEAYKLEKKSEPSEVVRRRWNTCSGCCTMKLLNGKIYLCSLSAVAGEGGILPESDNDYIDLFENTSADELKKKILIFWNRIYTGQYIGACKYCSGNPSIRFDKQVPVAEQTNEKLSFPKLY